MIIKTRQPSSSLLQLHHLKGRSSLDLSDYELELKGYYGEQLLDRIVSRVDFGNALVIQDLRLLDGKTERQFDTIVIVNQSAYILDANTILGILVIKMASSITVIKRLKILIYRSADLKLF